VRDDKFVLQGIAGISEVTNAGDVDLGTSNHWTGQRGTEKVDILIDGVASNSGEAQLLDELPCRPHR
jgi:hypothetical protein